jgi:hypothetical protein
MFPPVPQTVVIGKKSIWVTLILEEQNSFKIIGTWAEQFSGMGNFAKTIWNSTSNPCFSTFDQFLKEFCSSKINGLVMKTFSGK